MRAVDATELLDWQRVAWSPVIFWWDGREWVVTWRGRPVVTAFEKARGRPIPGLFWFWRRWPWFWDNSYDEQFEAEMGRFPGNDWRRLDTNRAYDLLLVPNQRGYYRVAVRYYFYETAYPTRIVPAKAFYIWVARHIDVRTGRTANWCQFS